MNLVVVASRSEAVMVGLLSGNGARVLVTGLSLLPALAFVDASPAAAVPVCDALRLYASATASGLCKSLSPASQNLQVCDLSNTNPDIHTTFNATTPLHITVRKPGTAKKRGCEDNDYFDGNWPGHLGLQHGATICAVNVQNYLARLNAVPDAGSPITVFTDLQTKGRLSPALANGYIGLSRKNDCR